MKTNRKLLILTLVAALVFSIFAMSACSSKDDKEDSGKDSKSDLKGSVMIAAAASLENALVDELIPMFNKEYPDVKVEGTYDSSGKLQEQIEGGLEADIFMSAAVKQMDALVGGGFIDSKNVVDVLENEVVLIKGKGSDTKVDSYKKIMDAKTIAIGDPASVPAGQYAEEVLNSLGLYDEITESNSIDLSKGTNVTEVLNWVAEGNAEVGIVYKTDAESMKDKVEIIESAPDGTLKTPVIYPMGLVDPDNEAAAKFFDFLKSDKAMKVFKDYGFKITK